MPYLGNNHIVGDSVNNFKVLDDISSFTATFDGSASSVVSTTNETIRVQKHRFVQGQRVTYNNGGGSNIGGLSSGTAYYVIYDTAHTIKLATSATNASSLTAINLNAVGSGTSHTLNVAFDGVNTKFRITHSNGTRPRFHHATQLSVAINNVVQRPNNDANNFTEGYAVEVRNIIVFKTAPTSNDIFFGSLTGETRGTFDIQDNVVDYHTADGSTTVYNLSQPAPNSQSLLVSLNGVVQHPSSDGVTRSYELIAGSNTIEFSVAPASGVEIQVRHLGFAGATSSDVTGFYGRTGNVGLTADDHITTGDITSRNINASGIITASSFIGDGSGLIGVASTDNIVTGTAATFNTFPVDINAGMTVAGVTTFSDDVKAIFGTGGDLEIYHSGTQNFIDSPGGNFYIRSSNQAGGVENAFIARPNAQTELYYNNVKKLETQTSGLNVYGASTAGGVYLKTSGGTNIGWMYANSSGEFYLQHPNSHNIIKSVQGAAIELYYNNVKRLETSAKGIKVGTGVTIETNGQATFTGIVTFGTNSTTIGDNVINVGTALTLGHTQGVQFHTQNLHSEGFEVNQINASGIITASSFSGDGSALTGLNSDVISDLTPQLGGNLDINGKDIVSTSNADIDIIPNGSGKTNFGGNNSIVLPSGSTGERQNVAGAIRFNTNLNLAEYYTGSAWNPIESPPTITNFSIDGGSNSTSAKINRLSGGNSTIVINGSGFDASAGTVRFEGEVGSSTVNTQSLVRNSTTQFTVTVQNSDFQEANDPYAIVVTNGSNLAARLASALDVNVPPVFVNSVDTILGTIVDNIGSLSGSTANASATDPDGDAITYSIVSGSLPTGLTLGSSTGYITGSTSGVSHQVYTFTVRATTAYGTADRQFKVEILGPPSGGNVSTSGSYTIHTFTSSGTFTNTINNLNVEYLVVAGGGGGGAKRGGGGGAGGMRTGSLTLSTGGKTVTVGSGGSRSGGGFSSGNSGNSSTFDSITSNGGGRGGSRNNGGNGGSGGGNGRSDGAGGTSGGSGTSGQGNNGGGHGGNHGGSGGGGKNGSGGGGGGGGRGSAGNSSISGSSVSYAEGGQGGTTYGAGGYSGGSGQNRPANTGHGADGGDDSPGYTGGAGGSGIVIVRYQL